MQSHIKKSVLLCFSVLALALAVDAEAQSAKEKQGEILLSKLQSVSTQLVPEFKQQFDNILEKQTDFKINSDLVSNNDPTKCLQISRRFPRDNQPGMQSKIRYYEFLSSKACLADANVNWYRELSREMTQWWFKSINVKYRSRLISFVYTHSFFNISQGYKLNLETDLDTMTSEFFALGGQALLDDRAKFEKTHPSAARLIDAVLFQGVDDISTIEKMNLEDDTQALPLRAKLKMVSKSNEAWFMRYHMIKNAKKSIRIQSYSLFDDIYGRATVALLLQAIKRGVDVKMSLDGRGSVFTSRSDLVELLVHQGARVSSYNPLFWNALNLHKFFYAGPIDGIMSSNHDKILIVDDEKILTGGRNIGNRYFVMDGEAEGKIYQDMEVYAECESFPAAAIIAFNIEFYSANTINVTPMFTRAKKLQQVMMALKTLENKMLGKSILQEEQKMYPEIDRINSLREFATFNPTPEPKLHLIEGLDKTSSLLGNNVLTTEIFNQINQAKESITIINPYVILSTNMKTHLINAGKRGVQITIVTTSPTSTDSKLTQARLIGEWRSILTDIPNLRLYGAFGPIKLHAKSFVFDSQVSIVGSYNLDLLSEATNSEFALKIDSVEFAKELKGFIDDYALNHSLEYDVAKNIGPHSQPNGQKKFNSMNRLRFLSRIVRPIL